MNNAVLNEWVPMEDVVIPDEVNFISVDTRDFHWFMSNELPSMYQDRCCRVTKDTPNLPFDWSTTDPKYIFFLINDLQVRCKDKKWNFLGTKNGGYWDLKYIWFKRENDGRFSVWTRNWGKPLYTARGLTALVNWENNDN